MTWMDYVGAVLLFGLIAGSCAACGLLWYRWVAHAARELTKTILERTKK